MIIDSFDRESPAKINPKRNENAPAAEAVIFTFSHVIEEYVVKNYACEKVGDLMMGHGSTAVYRITYHGKQYGFFRTWVGAPACTGTVEEIREFLNTDKIIHFGGAGCLNKEIARGKVMIPTEAYRDEGTSYHYAPASDYIRIKNAPVVEAFMKENEIPYVLGKTWTTDAFYRETCNNFEKRKADGCISVEMEGRPFRRSAISEGWRFICSLPAAIFWMRRNGRTEQRKDRSNTRSMIPDISKLRLRSRNM